MILRAIWLVVGVAGGNLCCGCCTLLRVGPRLLCATGRTRREPPRKRWGRRARTCSTSPTAGVPGGVGRRAGAVRPARRAGQLRRHHRAYQHPHRGRRSGGLRDGLPGEPDGACCTSQAVLPAMRERGYGRILHVASIAGKEGNAGMAAYSQGRADRLGEGDGKGIRRERRHGERARAGGDPNGDGGGDAGGAGPLHDRQDPDEALRRAGGGGRDDRRIVRPACSFTTGFTFDLERRPGGLLSTSASGVCRCPTLDQAAVDAVVGAVRLGERGGVRGGAQGHVGAGGELGLASPRRPRVPGRRRCR